MTKQQALDFLRAHQPLPADDDLFPEDVPESQSLIVKYDEVRKYFIRFPDAECIPLFLDSFGEIDGFGVYQMVEDVFRQFSAAEVVPHLIKALSSPHLGVRYWCAQIASEFPVPELIAPLANLLDDPDDGVRDFAAIALSWIKDTRIKPLLESALASSQDKDSRDLLREILSRPGHQSPH